MILGDLSKRITIKGDASNNNRDISIVPRHVGAPPNPYTHIAIHAENGNAGINLGPKELNQLLEAIHLALIAMRENT